jgi:hypothetical protein
MPTQIKNAPALKPGHLALNTAYHETIVSGSAALLIFWFLLTFVLRVAVLRWILLGNVLRVALALMFLWLLLPLLWLLLLWILFSFVTHIAPFSASDLGGSLNTAALLAFKLGANGGLPLCIHRIHECSRLLW